MQIASCCTKFGLKRLRQSNVFPRSAADPSAEILSKVLRTNANLAGQTQELKSCRI